MVTGLLVSAAILGGVGLTFASLIALTHRRFRVDEDPRLEVLVGMLPGSNCGACGCAGCRAFAEQLLDGTTQPAGCTVMGAEDVTEVAEFLGVEAGEANRRVARLRCAGGCAVAPRAAAYRGIPTCAAAAAVAGGGKQCAWGCLGLGDCAVVCDFDAIVMRPDELPAVIPERCTACGDCVEACPKDLFVLLPAAERLFVQCASPLTGDRATALCAVACNACGKCALDAAPGLVAMVDGLPVVDYSQSALAGPEAVARCPTGAIVWMEGPQFAARPAELEAALS